MPEWKAEILRRLAPFTKELLELADWLRACGVTHVALESTGVYWKPVWNLLEGQFEVLPVNAQHIKAVPGRRTDLADRTGERSLDSRRRRSRLCPRVQEVAAGQRVFI